KALLAANAPIAKTLRPARDESVEFDTTQNLFIEGDNLDALKLLQETYLGKVKMIYIDPPYNTGNDFIYADNFAQSSDEYFKRSHQRDEEGNRLVTNPESSGRFHSDWLSMMYPRLKLERNLLSDDGVIFISIDDNEVAQLRKICDEVFGATAFVALFPWRSRTAKADVPYGVSKDYEWILAYAGTTFLAGSIVERKYHKSDDYADRWRLQDLTTNKTSSERPNSFFTMINPKNGKKYPPKQTRTWSVTIDTFQDYYEKGKIVFPGDYSFLNIKRPAFRVFETEDKNKAMAKYGAEILRMPISTYLPENEVCRTEHGTKEIRDIFKQQYFHYPKPIGLVKFFVKSLCDTNALILDFFAGSSTTAHAVMQLNAEDGGNRRFIMVQLPEECPEESEAFKAGYKNIAEVSKERIRRAGTKIAEEYKEKHKQAEQENAEDLFKSQESASNPDSSDKSAGLDVGFRVLKIDSSNMADVFYTPDAVDQSQLHLYEDNLKPDRSPEDLLFQILLDWGVDLSLPVRKEILKTQSDVSDSGNNTKSEKSFEVFFVDENALVACFEYGVNEELVKKLAECKPLRVVFRDAGFKDDATKINVKQIFKQLSPASEVKVL
ncbi:MAG: site-specific DNA-methyltransferase, partial [Lentisphaerae bacterium]|nr:site-specific DNA-methyltransferase [Lentisphaerota bacterium]